MQPPPAAAFRLRQLTASSPAAGLPYGAPAAASPARCLWGAAERPLSSQVCFFSTRRRTAKAIADLRLRQHARREALARQRQPEKGEGALLPPAAAAAAAGGGGGSLLPKYAASPQALLLTAAASAPSFFGSIHVAPTPATRRSPPVELLHGPPRNPVGRVASLKSSELAAAVLQCAQQHRENGRLWQQLAAACMRWGPHLGAPEAAFVLHGFAAAGRKELPLLRRCADTLLLKWKDVRFVDAARALHALFAVFRVRDSRLLLRWIDDFGPLLQQQQQQQQRGGGGSSLRGLPPREALLQLYALDLLLKALAACRMPFYPLLSTAAEALRVHLEQLLPRQQPSKRLNIHHHQQQQHQQQQERQRIFSLPRGEGPIAGAGGRGGRLQRLSEALPASLLVSMLQSLGSLGVRHEPLLHAFDTLLATTMPTPKHPRPSSFLPPHSAPAAAAAGEQAACRQTAEDVPSARRREGSKPSQALQASGWQGGLPRGPRASLLQAETGGRPEEAEGGPFPWMGLRELSLALKALGAVGDDRSHLSAAWLSAVRACMHRCGSNPQELLLALEAAAQAAFFSRPLLQQLLRCLTRRAADNSLPIDTPTLLAAAAAAAGLPASNPAFWSVVNLRLSSLHAAAAAAAASAAAAAAASRGAAACIHPSSQEGCCMQEDPDRVLPVPESRGGPPIKEGAPGMRGVPLEEPLSLGLLAAAAEVVALAAPAVPVLHVHPVLSVAAGQLQRQAAPLPVCLRLLAALQLLRFKVTSAGPLSAFCCSPTSSNSSRREVMDLALLQQAEEALWGVARSQVEALLQRLKEGGPFVDSKDGEAPLPEPQGGPRAAAWRPLVEGPLAGGICQLEELCVYGLLHRGRQAGEGPLSPVMPVCSLQGGGGPASAASSGGHPPADVVQAVRGVVAARRSSCPLVFISVQEALAVLLLEVAPLIAGRGLEAAACLQLLPRPSGKEAPLLLKQHRQQAPQQPQTAAAAAATAAGEGGEGGKERQAPAPAAAAAAAAAVAAACSERGVSGSDPVGPREVTLARPHLGEQEGEGDRGRSPLPKTEVLQLVLSLLSSRAFTAPTPLLLHAALASLAALTTRLSSSFSQQQQQQQQQHQQQQQPQEAAWEGWEDPDSGELVAAICLLCLEALQQRLHHLHANQLAFLAAELQSLLSFLKPLLHPGAPKTAANPSEQVLSGRHSQAPYQQGGLNHQAATREAPERTLGRPLEGPLEAQQGLCFEGSGGEGNQQEAPPSSSCSSSSSSSSSTSIPLLVERASAVLSGIADRWLTAPATIASAGPSSSLHVWQQLEEAGRGGPSLTVQGRLFSGVCTAFSSQQQAADAVRCAAWLEALCPAASREVMQRLLLGGPSAAALQQQQQTQPVCGADNSEAPAARPSRTEDGLHATAREGGAPIAGLLREPRYRALRLTWLSQLLRLQG
ncbi:hypothetical protein Efla_006993 [Eimeria flavescens]